MNEPPVQPRWTPNENYSPSPQGSPGPPPYGGWPPQPGQPPNGGWPPQPSGSFQYQPPGGPPPRKKRHWVRNTFLAIAAVIVVIIVIAVANSGSGVSTTPSGSTSAGKPSASPAASKAVPAVASVGSYFDVKDSSGNTYRVTLVKIVDPAQGADQFSTADNGKRFVGTVFTIKALSGSPQNESADNDAAVIGSNGQTYNSDLNSIAGYTDFNNGQIDIAQGQSGTGAVTFQVPDGVKVTAVQWSAASGFGSTVQWKVS